MFGAEGRAAVEGQRHDRLRTLARSFNFDMVIENEFKVQSERSRNSTYLSEA